MSQTLTLARPYARAAYQASRDTGSTGDSGGTSVAGASLSAAVRRAAIVAEVEKTIKEGDKDKHENE